MFVLVGATAELGGHFASGGAHGTSGRVVVLGRGEGRGAGKVREMLERIYALKTRYCRKLRPHIPSHSFPG